MNPTTISTRLALANQALLFDLDALYSSLQQVKDRRKRPGVRYPLALILIIGILAKLAGQTSSRAIAQWAGLRQFELANLFALRRETMPHFSAWSRILGTAVDPDEVEEVVGRFFASRGLSLKILRAKGDYLWMIKENQKQMYQDIEALFEPQPSHAGCSAPPTDFRSASSLDKGHGRLERRRITVSSLLASYSQWPGLMQVFKVERQRTNALGETEREVQYGITSLPTCLASPKRLL